MLYCQQCRSRLCDLCSSTNYFTTVVDIKNNNNINDLPDEMLINIFSFLDRSTLNALSEVNQRWNKLGNQDFLWRRFIICYPGPNIKATHSMINKDIKERAKAEKSLIAYIRYSYKRNPCETVAVMFCWGCIGVVVLLPPLIALVVGFLVLYSVIPKYIS